MPLNKKTGKYFYTEDQYNIARYQSSAQEYARAAGYELVKSGNWYKLKDHDSFVFGSNGMWFWNSRDMRGGAIEFITQIEHRTLVEAVLILNGELTPQLAQMRPAPETSNSYRKKPESEDEKKPFVLPEKSGSYKRLFAYLCQTRGLDKEIVQELVQQKRIYESVKKYKDNEIHNAVFVSYNEEGTPVAAFQRGTVSTASTHFKGDVPGSDKEHYGWLMPGRPDAVSIAVFEASIDAVSHATLQKRMGDDYLQCHRMALGGCTNFQPLLQFMHAHPEIKAISIGFDNDNGGNKGAQDLCAALREDGYTKENGFVIYRHAPTFGKDFNEQLLKELQEEQGQYQLAEAPEPE